MLLSYKIFSEKKCLTFPWTRMLILTCIVYFNWISRPDKTHLAHEKPSWGTLHRQIILYTVLFCIMVVTDNNFLLHFIALGYFVLLFFKINYRNTEGFPNSSSPKKLSCQAAATTVQQQQQLLHYIHKTTLTIMRLFCTVYVNYSLRILVIGHQSPHFLSVAATPYNAIRQLLHLNTARLLQNSSHDALSWSSPSSSSGSSLIFTISTTMAPQCLLLTTTLLHPKYVFFK